jgi:hypothetical protein
MSPRTTAWSTPTAPAALLALALSACGGSGGGAASDDWYYHFACNGDFECLTTNSLGQPSGTIDVGPVESNCSSLMLFASKNWGAGAWDGCDHSPTFTPPGAGAITVAGLSATAGVPGTQITITGTGFPLGGAGITLDVGGVAVPVTSLSSTATTITFTVPAVAGRSGPITVHAPGGQATTSASFTILDDLSAVAWGAGRFVAVGAYGTALTSGDGVQWTARTTGVNPGLVSLASVAWAGSGFLAGGSNGYLLSSPDGATWTLPPSSLGMMTFNGIATSGAQVLAVASQAVTATSTTGTTWVTQSNSPVDLYNGVAWAGTQYVMTGFAILTSPDGTTWTTRVPQAAPYYGAAWSGTTMVAVGSAGAVRTSPDGVTWTARASGTSAALRAVTWFKGLFVAVGDGGTIVTSPDGITWSARTSGVAGALAGVAASATTAVAVGKAGLTLWSSDGIDWTSQLPPPPTAVAGTHEVGQSTITWTASPGATSYVVYASTSPAVSRTSYQQRATTTSSSAQLTGLGSGWWYVVVAGVNDHGEGAPSAPASVCVGLYICAGG